MTVWFTPVEAGEYAKVSTWTIRQAVKDGELQAYPVGKTGRHYRLTAKDVDAWMMRASYEPGRSA